MFRVGGGSASALAAIPSRSFGSVLCADPDTLLDHLGQHTVVLADKANDADRIGELIRDHGATPVQSPQSDGMAEAFVRTIERARVRVSCPPDARTVIDTLPIRFDDSNTVHPHKALGYLSPREFIASRQSL